LVDRLGTPRVFFFDRVSRGALVLAQAFASRGAAVVFEPSAVGNLALFREAWGLAHVVKYSHERLQELPPDVEVSESAPLQIETLGSEGLRYRSRLAGCVTKAWQRLESLPAEEVKDTAGAGDWCTAGIVHKLLPTGAAGLTAVDDTGLREAVRYGQALAAWNCGYEGARGGMYSVERQVFEQQIERILRGGNVRHAAYKMGQTPTPDSLASLCRSCGEVESPLRKPSRNGVWNRH
jgi:fructokinase